MFGDVAAFGQHTGGEPGKDWLEEPGMCVKLAQPHILKVIGQAQA